MEATGTGARERDLARLLALVERRVAGRLAAALSCSVDEWRVLSLLGDGRGHAMTEIAEYALLPPPTLTKLIDRMVAANRVHRRVDDADRRRVLVFLTPRGRDEHAALSATIEREWDHLDSVVGREEMALLSALLTRIAGRLP
ncbi:MarR family winged helix-turn-helix transcriptional regulator [Spirillospora sp. CA-294931]|uniref:MarR family winged helix-turn-helix transcriptional regulator n=1 Tax=Spirillospora sp. CA-294931 TaxID=3240042 RepID=UPI003D8F4F53